MRGTRATLYHTTTVLFCSHTPLSVLLTPPVNMLSLSLSLSCPYRYQKRARLTLRPIRSRPKLTEREPSASFDSAERASFATSEFTTPWNFLSKSERVRDLVIFLPRNLLSSAISIACDARVLLSLYFSLFFFFSFYENRVGSFNRGPVPWLLARPLAGFE